MVNKLGDPADKEAADNFNPSHRSGYTVGSLDYVIDRVRKGWSITPAEALKLVEHIDKLNITISNMESNFNQTMGGMD